MKVQIDYTTQNHKVNEIKTKINKYNNIYLDQYL